jgi:hypothetical protein
VAGEVDMPDDTGIVKGAMGARSYGDVCGRCYKKFEENDRVMIAHIFEKAGRNPMNLQAQGATFKGEFDVIHIDCNDPKLLKGPPK